MGSVGLQGIRLGGDQGLGSTGLQVPGFRPGLVPNLQTRAYVGGGPAASVLPPGELQAQRERAMARTFVWMVRVGGFRPGEALRGLGLVGLRVWARRGSRFQGLGLV